MKLSKGWELKRLGEICDVRDGTHDSPKYKSDGYPLITSKNFKELMEKRNAKQILKRLLNEGKTLCLLCSENKPNKCHRKLVAELLREKNVEIVHL